jgi:hypothetical protein
LYLFFLGAPWDKEFYGIFELRVQRNGQKRDKTKSKEKMEREKVVFFLNSFVKSF